VYADADRYVFDWDWVKEDPMRRGYPIDWKLRFGQPIERPPLANLAGVDELTAGKLDPHAAWLSRRGDCIFCYTDDAPAYARRVNDDLTVFYSRASQSLAVGCKLKNASRLIQLLETASAQSVTLYGPNIRVSAMLAQSMARQDPRPEYRLLFDDLSTVEPRVQNSPLAAPTGQHAAHAP
jgi:hypothetical protein